MSVCKRNNAVLLQYHYDAVGRLAALQSPMRDHQRFYSGATLCNEQRGDELHSHVATGRQLLGHRTKVNGVATVQLLGIEQQGCVVQANGDAGLQALAYTPHGEGADPSLPGFNGEQPDPVTGNYLLGNGYRAYNPGLMRFHSPDSFSPYGGGGLNAYVYCLGDPVNRSDPTGHISWQVGLGIGLGVLGLAYGGYALAFGSIALTTGVSAASAAVVVSGAAGLGAAGTGIAQALMAEGDPGSAAASALGWISLGLGGASAIAGMAANQWSPANRGKPRQVSGKMSRSNEGSEPGGVPTERLATYGMAVVEARFAARFGSFPSDSSHWRAMKTLMRLLGADDLISLASTSSGMRDLVYASRRTLGAVAPESLSITGYVRMIEAIGAGQIQGTLPAQLTRAGITQATLYQSVLPGAVMAGRGGARQARLRERLSR